MIGFVYWAYTGFTQSILWVWHGSTFDSRVFILCNFEIIIWLNKRFNDWHSSFYFCIILGFIQSIEVNQLVVEFLGKIWVILEFYKVVLHGLYVFHLGLVDLSDESSFRIFICQVAFFFNLFEEFIDIALLLLHIIV